MSVKAHAPLFSRRHVDRLLTHLDGFLIGQKVTDDSIKYHTAIATTDPDIVKQLPKFDEPWYEKLTSWLKGAYGKKQERALNELLHWIFLCHLPPSVTSHLAAMDPKTSLQELADTADRILLQLKSGIFVTTVSTAMDLMSVFFYCFTKMMEGWEAKLAIAASLQTKPRTRFRNSSSTPSRHRGTANRLAPTHQETERGNFL